MKKSIGCDNRGMGVVMRAFAGIGTALFFGLSACGAADTGADYAQSPSQAAQYYDGVRGVVTNSAMSKAAGADYGYATETAEYSLDEMDMADGGSYRMQNEEAAGTPLVTESGSVSENKTNRKLIRNVDMSVETKEFDDFLAGVEEQVNALGGYVESMNTYNGSRYSYDYYGGGDAARHSYLTVRIPQNRLDDFLNVVSESGHVISRGESVEDVTLTYVDMESRKKSLQTELERLQALLEKADTLEDIIALEDRMSTVRYQLESMESQLRTYDNRVDYSTVQLTIQEVKELTPVEEEEETIWERLINGFQDSLEDLKDGFVECVIWIVIHIPYLIVWAMGIAVIVLLIRAICVKRRKKKEQRSADKKGQEARAVQQVKQDGEKEYDVENGNTSGSTGENTNAGTDGNTKEGV